MSEKPNQEQENSFISLGEALASIRDWYLIFGNSKEIFFTLGIDRSGKFKLYNSYIQGYEPEQEEEIQKTYMG